jgi:hypothetical protein
MFNTYLPNLSELVILVVKAVSILLSKSSETETELKEIYPLNLTFDDVFN